MAESYFGNSEEETENRVFATLDNVAPRLRVPQDALIGRVRHMISGENIRPDGLIAFPRHEQFRCLSGRVFALEIKPDVVVRDHLKVISELTEQARSYVDSSYEREIVPRGEVDGCIIYPNLDVILTSMQPSPQGARFPRNDDYKQGVIDMQRRSLTRQRIYELVPTFDGFDILCCDEWLCRFTHQGWRVSGKNHQFQRKVGSDYR